jgi:signal transduction histidine kinase
VANFRKNILARTILPLAIAVLPIVLLYSAVRTFRELDEQRAIYLRHRVSILVGRLEQVSNWEELGDIEPYLAGLQVIERGGAGDSARLASIWAGEELFRTEFVSAGVGSADALFRAHVPFHSNGGLRIARIDLSAAAADFLVLHARHNVIAASVGGLVLVMLSTYSLWATQRNARLQVRQLELEHMAHIGKMSAVLAHEIRNPLGTIKGFIQLAGERSGEATRTLLAPAVTEVRRLEELVKDLLAYGRPAAPQWRQVQWLEVARTTQHHAQHLIGGRAIRFSVTDADLAWPSDPALLEQALLNLLRNAVEAIPEASPGEIRLDAAMAGSELLIRVTDTGAGLEPAVRARLFEPFVTTKASGTGLGLAITRRIAVSLGGDLALAPAPTRGVEAVLRFPLTARSKEDCGIDTDRG